MSPTGGLLAMNLRRSGTTILILLSTLLLSTVAAGCSQGAFTGPYLGQQPPGRTPELFAPGFIRSGVHATAVSAPAGDEVYWSLWSDRGEQTTMYSRLEDGRWTSPAEAPFSTAGGAGNPCFSPDGKRLFFTSQRRPGQPDDPAAKESIWQAERTAAGWSTPRLLHHAVNDLHVHWLISVSESGDLYFGASETRGDQRDIYRARIAGGEYSDVVKLGPEINTDAYEDCPYIARDGSYLIFTRVVNTSRTDSDLLVCSWADDGGWGEAVNMGPTVNSGGIGSGSARAYWVSARIIDELRQSAKGG